MSEKEYIYNLDIGEEISPSHLQLLNSFKSLDVTRTDITFDEADRALIELNKLSDLCKDGLSIQVLNNGQPISELDFETVKMRTTDLVKNIQENMARSLIPALSERNNGQSISSEWGSYAITFLNDEQEISRSILQCGFYNGLNERMDLAATMYNYAYALSAINHIDDFNLTDEGMCDMANAFIEMSKLMSNPSEVDVLKECGFEINITALRQAIDQFQQISEDFLKQPTSQTEEVNHDDGDIERC